MSLHLEFKRDTGIKLYSPDCTHPELGNSVLIRSSIEPYIKWLEQKVEHLGFQIEEYKSEMIVNNSIK